MFHTVAFDQATTSATGFLAVAPLVDPTVGINGNNLLIPDKLNNLFGWSAYTTSVTGFTKAQLQSPSLREIFFPSASPLIEQATVDVNPHITEYFDNPLPLVVNEGLNVFSDGNKKPQSGRKGAVVFLSDGPRTKITKSKIFSMRFTAAVQSAVSSWTSGALTLDQTLPVGNYDVVGMRVEAAGLLAARLIFIGQVATIRPGCPGNAGATTLDLIEFRYGNLGTWGTFYSLTPPSLEVYGGTAASQVGYLDLIQR